MEMSYPLSYFEELEKQVFSQSSHQCVPKTILQKVMDIYDQVYPKSTFPVKRPTKISNIHFQVIPKAEPKTVIESESIKIRSLLNKLIETNYDLILEEIDAILMNMVEDKEVLGTMIFEIACNNRFYSSLYANLYTYFIHKYEFMRKIFEDSYSKYISLFSDIESADPSIDYNKFCENNKKNEKRKSMSTFITNLYSNDILQDLHIQTLLRLLLQKIIEWKTDSTKKNEIDEITENIFILYKI